MLLLVLSSLVVLAVQTAQSSQPDPKHVEVHPWEVSKTQWKGPVPRNHYSSYIIDGRAAADGEFPFMLSLEWTNGPFWYHWCGAVLIDETTVLTAASCLFSYTYQWFRIGYGAADRRDSMNVALSSYTLHPNFDSSSFLNDIAIAKLATPIDISNPNVGTIALPMQGEDHVSQHCTITGWGVTLPGGYDYPFNLQKLVIPVIEHQDCVDRMNACDCGVNIPMEQVCVYEAMEVGGSCTGDFGGPLACRSDESSSDWRLAGIGSYGIGNDDGCLKSYPSVYSRVGEYLDFIESNRH